jgi:hypothetical protein
MTLSWLARRTRYDILPAISHLSTRCQTPTKSDQLKLHRVLAYVLGTRDKVLILSPRDASLHVYADASYAVHTDLKGHTGIVVTFGLDGGPVFCYSSKQRLISKSSTEAELIALDKSVGYLMAMTYFLEDLGINVSPVHVYQDNQSSIKLTENGYSCMSKTKHIGIRYFYVKERVDAGDIVIHYKSTDTLVADFFTKPLIGNSFYTYRDMLHIA